MIHLTDDQLLFLLALGAILVVLGILTLIERAIHWLREQCTIEEDGDPIEIHAKKPNGL